MVNTVPDENMLIEKEKEFRKKEMDKINRAIKISMIPGIIAALLAIMYFSALPENSDYSIAIPANISKTIERGENGSPLGSYKESNIFKSVPIGDLSYFRQNEMDRIFAIAKYDAKTDNIWLLVRGIKHADFPKVYDYHREFGKSGLQERYLFRTKGVNLEILADQRNIHPFAYFGGYLPLAENNLEYHNPYAFSRTEDAYPRQTILITNKMETHSANVIAITIFAGVMTSFVCFAIMTVRPSKKHKDR